MLNCVHKIIACIHITFILKKECKYYIMTRLSQQKSNGIWHKRVLVSLGTASRYFNTVLLSKIVLHNGYDDYDINMCRKLILST